MGVWPPLSTWRERGWNRCVQWRRRSGPAIEHDHPLGPDPRGKCRAFLETGDPIVRVGGIGHNESLARLDDDQLLDWHALEPQFDPFVFDPNVIVTQPNLRVSQALAGGNVILHGMPGAGDDFTIPNPLNLPVAGFAGSQRA